MSAGRDGELREDDDDDDDQEEMDKMILDNGPQSTSNKS